ncbi:MAG: phosphatase PAP2 family protein [Pseudonocardiales bacterium]|nr:phosphatase PAP2 family protein [Pseudonocardiales bacterium]
MLQRRSLMKNLASTDHQEIALLAAVQRRIAVPRVVTIARGMSHFGEHALGWLALGALGTLVDRRRRRDWLLSAAAVAAAHGTSIALKRVVRRHRPIDPSIAVLAGTPSRLSFPSSHAASTTAAAILYGGLLRRRLSPLVVPPMLISRLVLGVHYPSDVLAGSALGAAIGAGMRRRLRGSALHGNPDSSSPHRGKPPRGRR